MTRSLAHILVLLGVAGLIVGTAGYLSLLFLVPRDLVPTEDLLWLLALAIGVKMAGLLLANYALDRPEFEREVQS